MNAALSVGAEESVASRGFTSRYVVDPSKLARINGILEFFYGGPTEFDVRFEALLANGKALVVPTLDELLALDNTNSNRIASIEMTATGSLDSAGRDTRVTLAYDGRERNNVRLAVQGTPPPSVTRLFAELEEQVERTLGRGWYRTPAVVQVGAFLVGIVAAISVLAVPKPPGPSRFFVAGEEASALIERYETATTVEDKLDALFEVTRTQIRNALAIDVSPRQPRWTVFKESLSGRNVALAMPFLVALACGFYLAKFCYPRTVFRWGDYGEHYDKLLETRKNLQWVVGGGLLLGIVASLFVANLAPGPGAGP